MSVQRFNQNHSDTQPYHIYYDMNLINNDSSFPAQPVRFQYKETRSNAFLLSPQDYYMSIVRFNLQTPTLPVFILVLMLIFLLPLHYTQMYRTP